MKGGIVSDIPAGLINAAKHKAETFRGRDDLERISTDARQRHAECTARVKRLRTTLSRTPQSRAKNLMAEIYAAEAARDVAAVDYIAARVASGVPLEEVTGLVSGEP